VDQEQIHVVEAELGECPVEGFAGISGFVGSVAQLAGDEDL
jgi:hypothetical protein